MDCSEAKPQLADLAAGRIGPIDEAELRAHLEGCEECSLEVELLQGRSAAPSSSPDAEADSPLEVAPLAPLAPQHSDWTVEKIFGDGGRPGAPSAAPPGIDPSVPAPPSAPHASIFPSEDLAPAPRFRPSRHPPSPVPRRSRPVRRGISSRPMPPRM